MPKQQHSYFEEKPSTAIDSDNEPMDVKPNLRKRKQPSTSTKTPSIKREVLSSSSASSDEADESSDVEERDTSFTPQSSTKVISSDGYIHCKSYANGVERPALFIFSPSDKQLGYTFGYGNGRYRCRGCLSAQHESRILITAKIGTNEDGEEVLLVQDKKHICEPRPYGLKPSRFHLGSEKYEVITHERGGNLRHRLIVFANEEKSKCYEFYWSKKWFLCSGCSLIKMRVSAKVMQDEKGEDYLAISSREHACEARPYRPEKYMTKVIRKPAYVVVKDEDEERKLIVFDKKDQNLCYEYTFDPETKTFACASCGADRAKIINEGVEGEYLQLNRYHLEGCQLQPFKPEEVTLEVEKPKKAEPKDNKFRHFTILNSDPKKVILIVFTDSTQKNCFVYPYLATYNAYCCRGCRFKAQAKICTDRDGSQHVICDPHACKPRKYDPAEFGRMSAVAPENLLIVHSIKGNQLIMIFSDKSKRHAYDFSCRASKTYGCTGCSSKGKYLTIKLRDEGVVESNGAQHVCDIIDLVAADRYIENSLFNYETGLKYIIVRCPDRDGFYYKFGYDSERKAYCCVQCDALNKCITATICQNEDGKDFLIMNNKHFCKPFFRC